MPRIVLTQFALDRHWDSTFAGTKLANLIEPSEFQDAINLITDDSGSPPLEAGYAPFCKHLWVPNSFGVLAGVAPIAGNEDKLRTGYEARRASELPVLTRWLDSSAGIMVPPAEWLDVILYSGDHLRGEGVECKADWGVVSINAEVFRRETPLNPMTQLRNALGVEQGGSGKPIDREAYMAAVEFWSKHANIR